ncbi:MAG: DUF4097 family beta strand repeat-containing protein, partial [Longimicrobiales bacterium]
MRLASGLLAVCMVLGGANTAVWADRAEGSFDRTLSVTGPVQLDVKTGSGTIAIRRGAGSSVRIQARISANDRFGNAAALVREIEQNPPIRQSGNTIVIGSDVRKWNRVGISYDLTVPEETQATAQTGSGNIDCYDVRGPVKTDTGSGNIRVENSANPVDANTGSGNIVVNRAGGSVKAGTGSGNIQLVAVNGSADTHTGSGDISVSGATGAVRARTGSGTVRVERATAELSADAGSGGVVVDGAPKSARWDLRTGSGSVRVTLPPGTPFELDAHTGSGTISTAHQ